MKQLDNTIRHAKETKEIFDDQIDKAEEFRDYIREKIVEYAIDKGMSPVFVVGGLVHETVNIIANMAHPDKNPVKEFSELNVYFKDLWNKCVAAGEEQLCEFELEGKDNG